MILVIAVFVFAAFIGLVMEVYKKKIRKDRAGDWENIIIAFLLSGVFGFISYRIAEATGFITTYGGTPFLIIPFTILIYILQRPVCLSFWKPLLKKWMEKKLDE